MAWAPQGQPMLNLVADLVHAHEASDVGGEAAALEALAHWCFEHHPDWAEQRQQRDRCSQACGWEGQ